jgi:hypothetical protein
MCGVLRKALQRLYDHGFNAGIVNPARRPAARLVMQPVHPPLDKTPPPLAHRRPVEAKRGRHLFVLAAFRTGQHDPSPQASACAVFRRIVSDFSSARSSSLNVKGESRWTAIGNSIAICLHLWHSDANLLRIYDCELVTRDTRSTSPRAAWQSSAGSRCRHTSARDGGSSACRFR